MILVRHGQSEGNVDKRKYENVPDFALNLTEEGINQALNTTAKRLKKLLDKIRPRIPFAFLSPPQTYAQIAKNIVAHVIKVFEDRIREQDWGHFRHLEVGEETTKIEINTAPLLSDPRWRNLAQMF
ncbi:MAG: histidine phosphatase family protein [Anaerolineales bacterium]|nr:histidine phosphatase family protein [Anaerolineales bacterium]